MANQRLNATIQIGGTVARSLTRGLTNTRGQIGELQSTIGKATRRQTMLSREIDRMGRQGMNVEPLRRQYAQLGDEIDRARRKQARLQRLADANVGGRFSTMAGEVGRLARNTAVAAGVLGTGIFGVANSTAELGDQLAKTADNLGIQIGKYQELRYAAERSGVSTQKFDSNMQAFTKRLGEAAQGSGAAKDALEQLGLSAQSLASMTPDEALAQVADRLQQVESQTERVAIVSDLFSRQGIGMINMLKGGSEGLRQFGEDARRTGYILSDKAARDAETFQDKLLDTQLSLFGLKNIIGADLMPVVSDMMAQFTGWLSENRAQVREWSALFAERLQAAVPVIGELASGVATVATKVGHAVGVTADLVGGFDNLGMIIGTAIAGKAIASIVSFGGAIFQAGSALLSLSGALPVVAGGIKAIGAALMANPIGLIIGAIAGAGYLIYRNWERIGPWFASLWDGIKETAAWAWDGLKTIISWSPLGMIVRGWAPMAQKVGEIVGGAKEMAGAAWDWMRAKLSWSPLETISNAWGGVRDWFAGLWDGITAAAESAMNWITSKLEWVGNAFGKVRDWLSFGDDEDATGGERPRLGAPNGPVDFSFARSREDAEQRGQAAAERALPRPAFTPEAPGASTPAERVREVVNHITNNLTLHVTRREGEGDGSYAERIADMVMERINDQQGALHDG